MIDIGSGPPVIVVPGINGRWELLRPAMEALATRCRVITASLPGEPGSDAQFATELGFDNFIQQVDDLWARARLPSAAICGISFGGLIALRYAARRPEKVSALVLVSSLGPHWHPARRESFYMRWPMLAGPLFLASTARRVLPEIRSAFPDLGGGLAFSFALLARLLAAPAVPTRMSRRAQAAARETFADDCLSVRAPTLVVTGEPHLDRVIGVRATMEYVERISGAKAQVLERTGHLGVVTAPERFAAKVGDFILAHASRSHLPAWDAVLQDFPAGEPGASK